LLTPFKQVFILTIISEPAEQPHLCEEFLMPMHFTVKAPELSLQSKIVPG